MNTFTADIFDNEKTVAYEQMIATATHKKELVDIYRFLLCVSDNSYMSNNYIQNRYIAIVDDLINKVQARLLADLIINS